MPSHAYYQVVISATVILIYVRVIALTFQILAPATLPAGNGAFQEQTRTLLVYKTLLMFAILQQEPLTLVSSLQTATELTL